MNYGIVDIGSNTIRLNVYQVEENGYTILFSKKYTVGLASYFEEDKLSREGIEGLKVTISNILNIKKSVKIEQMLFFATASLRNATNNQEIIVEIKDELGITIDLLSQDEESRLGHIGIEEVYGKTDGLFVDIGGGSSEVAIYQDDGIVGDASLSIGSLSLSKEFVKEILPVEAEFFAMRNHVKGLLRSKTDLGTFETLFGIGGTVRAIGRVIQSMGKTESSTQFSVKQLKNLSKKMVSHDKRAFKTLIKIAPDRLHTFVPGMAILLEICKKYDVETVFVSNKGIREGYLLDYLEKNK
ncbi:Ppx/GppA phosphatase family protein [Streptococcus merionis]|uniref:Ppx/GppA phosphatase family protein n=1 Tax=Streptococcus merionis TaxID=400065 RepID=UPI0035174268